MKIETMRLKDVKQCLDIFNETTKQSNFLYEPLTIEQFKTKFLKSGGDYLVLSFVLKEAEEIIGFASGVYDPNGLKAYITMVIINEPYRRKGFGKLLLNKLENSLHEKDLRLDKIDIVFFNPVQFNWIIPNTHAVHPNAPGVDMNSDAYLFFKRNGYVDFAHQNSYYRDITNYEFSPKTKKALDEVKEKGFEISYYNPNKHHGLAELMDNLNSEGWRKEILNHAEQYNEKNTILVPTYHNLVVGFTGPLKVQPNKRGYFAGIGTHSEYRGHGLGKALFASLVMGLKEMGAEYMTLFTGTNNPAKNMYEGEDFKVVRSWADMRKGLSL